MTVSGAFRVEPGASVQLNRIDPGATPVGPHRKKKAAKRLRRVGIELDALQETLWAEGRAENVDGGRRVLVVLQGMDTSGKGGVVRHVGGLLNPQGVQVTGFGVPTANERRHDFLWRVRRRVPAAGVIGFFDRSHYEDVLITRVQEVITKTVARERLGMINDFEAELAESGVTLLKCFLHISAEEQRKRLLARIDNPAKRWKYSPDDLAARGQWSRYQQVYEDTLSRTGTELAPWHIIPADHKWYRNWAVARLLLESLRDLAPQFPPPVFDVDTERMALTTADPLG